ncbi:Phosphate-import permease protein PhnE [Planctomycetes bacterium Pla163]|uniref:Phosphate-import permease protein PhnE n=1 Tax=Rohdeia mirabilis TaxID=2528008 RepID=A0A518CZT6_9BACT|nr:Phosphate-import permease protein PhnE [Planctomycetes bacterium Pla163]
MKESETETTKPAAGASDRPTTAVTFAARIERAARGARVRAVLLDFLLVWYAVGGGLFWARWTFNGPAPPWERPESIGSSGHLVLAAVALVLALLWSRSRLSPGRMITWSTHPLLKADAPRPEGGWWRTVHGILVLAILAETVALGWKITEIDLVSLFSSEGLAGAGRIFGALFRPEFGILPLVLEKMIETIYIALVATVVAVPIAFLLSFFGAKNLMSGNRRSLAVYGAVRFSTNLMRSIEPVLWAIIFTVWVSFGPFAGMLALLVHSVASLVKLYSEQVESIDAGPVEAIEATGANRVQMVWYAVVPQIVLPYLGFTIYRWDINVRMATIIGLVGGGGVGELLMQYLGLAKYGEVGMIVVVITAVVWALDYASAKVREAIA